MFYSEHCIHLMFYIVLQYTFASETNRLSMKRLTKSPVKTCETN